MARGPFRKKEKCLHLRLIEHYISAGVSNLYQIILTDSLKIKEISRKTRFFDFDLE